MTRKYRVVFETFNEKGRYRVEYKWKFLWFIPLFWVSISRFPANIYSHHGYIDNQYDHEYVYRNEAAAILALRAFQREDEKPKIIQKTEY